MPAPLGNQNALKLTDDNLKKEAYRQYCEHIAAGNPKMSWAFIHPTEPLKSLTSKTMDKYIRENPVEFPAILKDVAKASCFGHYMEEGKKLMRGEYRHGSPVVWQTIMRNIFKSDGWDVEDTQNLDTRCAADDIVDKMGDLKAE